MTIAEKLLGEFEAESANHAQISGAASRRQTEMEAA